MDREARRKRTDNPRMRGQEAQQGPSPCIAEKEKRPAIMDQIAIKTPNPKCRLFLKIDQYR
jgi:hypothetical protein